MTQSVQAEDNVNFSRDILPILSDRCFHCHGPDESHREAELRLDQRESAIMNRGDYAVIVPGNPEKSELLTRITTSDADILMPPPDSHRKPLTAEQIAVFKQWIAEGAKWGKHWAFEKPQKPNIPQSERHPIDFFVSRRLSDTALKMSPAASKRTLARRVSFDLTGLPPTSEELQQFLEDDSEDAYSKYVDRLLASPHFGERMAMWWLDVARYSDTDGYQQDATRTNWPWRDWVVQSFNQNKPFDQFTIEQFAGDLLPNSTPEQKLATCFHRNHMTNGEGGRIPEESRIDYVIDRVNTTGTVWMGLTLGCTQCHSHKFDPISQKDYYQLFAFFDSIEEDGRAGRGAKPYMKYKSPFVASAIKSTEELVQSRRITESQARKNAEAEFTGWLDAKIAEVKDGFEPWNIRHPEEAISVGGQTLTVEVDGTIQTGGKSPRQDDYRIILGPTGRRTTGIRLEVFPHDSHQDGKLTRGSTGEFILTNVKLQVRTMGESQLREVAIASAVADAETKVSGRKYGKVKDTLDDDPRNGWTTETHDPMSKHVAVFALAEPLKLAENEELVFVMMHRSTIGNANIGRFRVSTTNQPGQAVRSLKPMPMEQLAAGKIATADDVSKSLRDQLFQQFLTDHDAYQTAKRNLDAANKQLSEFKRASAELSVMVLKEREKPRTSYVLQRGVWDKKGDAVSRGFPSEIFPGDAREDASRLELAKWLVSRDNPLTARVTVNHIWQLCFGAGLVRTVDDFGHQGELPTHPDLLDWLAVDFMEHDWDVKYLMKLIVTSKTYRQSSRLTKRSVTIDPENRLLARGARYRLPSWMIRDAALRTSGLLTPTIGGPPIRPYQPDGVWAEIFMGRFRYEPSQGASQFRRTLYAFWRRASAPTFLFDAAQRRVCEVQQRRTNTPLHALTLLNDATLLEASRELAKQSIADSTSTKTRLEFLYGRILSRSPTAIEIAVLKRELAQASQHYQATPDDAIRLLKFGQPENIPKTNQQEIAAYMVISSMVYNLDEAITHE